MRNGGQVEVQELLWICVRVGKSSLFHKNNNYYAVANIVQLFFLLVCHSVPPHARLLEACQIPIAQLILAALKNVRPFPN